MEGEGWERVRQSGRLSGVWTCLAACTKQRKWTQTRRFSALRISERHRRNAELALPESRRVFFIIPDHRSLSGGEDFKAETGAAGAQNTGLGGVTPCTQRCLPLSLSPSRLIHTRFF